jgi:hypothetical protein
MNEFCSLGRNIKGVEARVRRRQREAAELQQILGNSLMWINASELRTQ